MVDGTKIVRGGVLCVPRGTLDDGLELKPLELTPPPVATLFLLHGHVVELMRFTPSHGSWMYISDNEAPRIEPDGTLTMVTRVDSLFVALCVLSGQKSGMFEPADALLEPLRGITVQPDQLALLCETKKAGSDTYYRFDRARAEKWLDSKVHRLKSRMPLADAASIVAQYLPQDWANSLTERYPVAEENKDVKITDAQQLALTAMQNDARAEDEAMAIAESEPPKKKKKVTKKPPPVRVSRPVTSFFKKK